MINNIRISSGLSRIDEECSKYEERYIREDRNGLIQQLLKRASSGRLYQSTEADFGEFAYNKISSDGIYLAADIEKLGRHIKGQLSIEFKGVSKRPALIVKDDDGVLFTQLMDKDFQSMMFTLEEAVLEYWLNGSYALEECKAKWQDTEKIKIREQKRHSSHSVGTYVIYDAFKNNGIEISVGLAKSLFEIVAYLYPHEKSGDINPFPKLCLQSLQGQERRFG